MWNLRLAGLRLAGGALLLLSAGAASAATWVVAPDGDDSGPGTLENPFASFAAASQLAFAGDTVIVRGGVYHETLRPARSGVPGAPIVFSAHPGEQPVITGVATCVLLNSRSHIVVDGIGCDGLADGPPISVQRGVAMGNASYNVVRNGTYRNQTKNGFLVDNGSHHHQILGNVVEYVGDGLAGTGEGIRLTDTTNSLIEGNTLSFAGHDLLRMDRTSYSVVRGNDLRNLWWRSVEVTDPTSRYNLFEHNVIRDGRVADTSKTPPMAFKIWSPHNIIRRNVLYDNISYGLRATAAAETAPRVDSNRIYHNVFYRNGRAGWANIDDGNPLLRSDSNLFVNNILYKNFYSHGLGFNTAPTQIQFDLASRTFEGNVHWNNAIRDERPAEAVINAAGISQASIYWFQANHPEAFFANLDVNPRFVDEAARDFRLEPTSACVDAGAFLTRTRTHGSGQRIPLEDASFFSDGYEITLGDWIQLEGGSERVTVCEVNYETQMITVSAPLVWTAGQRVALAYAGAAPDIGAFELGEREGGPGNEGCPPPDTAYAACSDGVDNDGDGHVDYPADPGCAHPDWQTEAPACDDDLDNDGDGGTDWDGGAASGAPDPSCVGRPWAATEARVYCGFGFELALLLAPLGALRRRPVTP